MALESPLPASSLKVGTALSASSAKRGPCNTSVAIFSRMTTASGPALGTESDACGGPGAAASSPATMMLKLMEIFSPCGEASREMVPFQWLHADHAPKPRALERLGKQRARTCDIRHI